MSYKALQRTCHAASWVRWLKHVTTTLGRYHWLLLKPCIPCSFHPLPPDLLSSFPSYAPFGRLYSVALLNTLPHRTLSTSPVTRLICILPAVFLLAVTSSFFMARRSIKARLLANSTIRPDLGQIKKMPKQLPDPDNGRGYPPYDPQISRQRLEVLGYHPDATVHTQEDIEAEWTHTAELYLNRPTRDEYTTGHYRQNLGKYSYSDIFTSLTADVVNAAPANADNGIVNLARNNAIPIPKRISSGFLAMFSGNAPQGAAISMFLAKDGYKTIESFAVACPQAWAQSSSNMAVWDFSAQVFHHQPRGNVFLALNPEYSIQDADDEVVHAGRCERLAKESVAKVITQVHNACGPTTPFWGPPQSALAISAQTTNVSNFLASVYTLDAVNMIRSLPHIHGIRQKMERFVPVKSMVYQPYAQTALKGLLNFLAAIEARSQKTHVLHLTNLPLVDRRIVAVILRSCPQITMIGIYDCPLIHFGDVICLLDLIHEVNQIRKAKNQPPVQKFDFFPHFNMGIPYVDRAAGTHGITWSSVSADLAQRGIFRILLEAYNKACCMGLELLFEEGKAFRQYLAQLPLQPLAVVNFLSGLMRHHDAQMRHQTRRNRIEVREGMYDALKAVRLGIENISRDGHEWYGFQMGEYLVFCSSCGNEMVEEFFTQGQRDAPPYSRVCAGCVLRGEMDTERNQQKQENLSILLTLFPAWNGLYFNADAPMNMFTKFMRIRARINFRPPPPPMQEDRAGHLFQPQFVMPLVRDNKAHYDSLQGLPSLKWLVYGSERQWQSAIHVAMVTDVERVTAHLLGDHYPESIGMLAAFKHTRLDRAKPNHFDEGQGRPRASLQFCFESALVIKAAIHRKAF
ncbi:hypothetical protein B0J13DRAFT_655168 [Dactylonectria estremocensis]|uniref:Uncharacterized protein n=1 Tax=Dactylonectria estremocensis TaxID=1079267 RepID=A0A9P9F763_9HYPO|nr:hypothetical protein B0J13DRAFT_655168 [Dactylonectria estremocensis]